MSAINLAVACYWLATLALWGVVAVTCFILYCLFPLRALPWAAAAYLVTVVTTFVMQYLFHGIGRSHPEALDINSSASLAAMITSAIEECTSLLIAILLLAEIVVLVVRAHPSVPSRFV